MTLFLTGLDFKRYAELRRWFLPMTIHSQLLRYDLDPIDDFRLWDMWSYTIVHIRGDSPRMIFFGSTRVFAFFTKLSVLPAVSGK
jgi:hypothetical protein